MITLFLWISGITFYLIGVMVFINNETIEDIEIDEGGFLGMPVFDCTHRKATPKDARKSLIWPLFFLCGILKVMIYAINDVIYFIGLLFGLDYSKTKLYKFIDEKFF